MDAALILGAIAGFIQPWLQEIIVSNKINQRAAHALTVTVSLVISAIVLWLTGAFANTALPPFSLRDPSPFVGEVLKQWMFVYGIASITFGFASVQVHELAGSTTGTPVAPSTADTPAAPAGTDTPKPPVP